jgi:hypothetical protein
MKVKRIAVRSIAKKPVFPDLTEHQALYDTGEDVVCYALGLWPDEVREFTTAEAYDRQHVWGSVHRFVSGMWRCGFSAVYEVRFSDVLDGAKLRRRAKFN